MINFSVTTTRDDHYPRKSTFKKEYTRTCVILVVLHGRRWLNMSDSNDKYKTDKVIGCLHG